MNYWFALNVSTLMGFRFGWEDFFLLVACDTGKKDKREMCDQDLWAPKVRELTWCTTGSVGVLSRDYGRTEIKEVTSDIKECEEWRTLEVAEKKEGLKIQTKHQSSPNGCYNNQGGQFSKLWEHILYNKQHAENHIVKILYTGKLQTLITNTSGP